MWVTCNTILIALPNTYVCCFVRAHKFSYLTLTLMYAYYYFLWRHLGEILMLWNWVRKVGSHGWFLGVLGDFLFNFWKNYEISSGNLYGAVHKIWKCSSRPLSCISFVNDPKRIPSKSHPSPTNQKPLTPFIHKIPSKKPIS